MNAREPVDFITAESGDDLIVGFAIEAPDPGGVISVVLQRTPRFEILLPPEDRGVLVSHERFPYDDRELVRRIVVEGSYVEIVSTVRTYHLDLSSVDTDEVREAISVLRRMHRYGGFDLVVG